MKKEQHINFEGDLHSINFPGYTESLANLEDTVWIRTHSGVTRLNKAMAQEMVKKLNQYIESGIFPTKEF